VPIVATVRVAAEAVVRQRLQMPGLGHELPVAFTACSTAASCLPPFCLDAPSAERNW